MSHSACTENSLDIYRILLARPQRGYLCGNVSNLSQFNINGLTYRVFRLARSIFLLSLRVVRAPWVPLRLSEANTSYSLPGCTRNSDILYLHITFCHKPYSAPFHVPSYQLSSSFASFIERFHQFLNVY